MALQLARINQFKLDEILKFAATHFSRHQVILRYLNITPEMYEKTFTPLIKACYNSGFSFAATNQSELASVMLALPYKDYMDAFKEISPNSVTTELSPVVALLSQVSSSYKPDNGKKTLNHFIGCTNQKFRGNRYLQKLIPQIQQEASKQGYEEYIVGCTGKGPQNIFQSLKYEEKNRINYNKFHHEGKVPFVNLIDSDCVKLMSKKVKYVV